MTLLMVQTRGSEQVGRQLLGEAGIPLRSATRTRALNAAFELKATPTSVLVAGDGTVARRVVGGKGHAYFARELEALLKHEPAAPVSGEQGRQGRTQ